MAPVDSRDYVLGGIYYSVLVRNTCQHSQQTRRWPNSGPPSATLAQHQTNTGSTPRVCWELRSAGLVLLNTAGDDYKPTPTQCLLNVESASLVLASIHSVLVSTSCWGTCMFFFKTFFFQIAYTYIYTFTVHTIYSTEQKKTRQYVRGLAKWKQFQTSKKIWIELTTSGNQSPTWTENLVHVVAGDE